LIQAADEILGKLSEAAAGIVKFIRLRVASSQEGLIECYAPYRFGSGDGADFGGNFLKSPDERNTRAVVNEFPGAERVLDFLLNGILLQLTTRVFRLALHS
jgi:hypothetical protein